MSMTIMVITLHWQNDGEHTTSGINTSRTLQSPSIGVIGTKKQPAQWNLRYWFKLRKRAAIH
ncbi:hypothetical protein Pint_33997 [Pistacia integerrima]|uniref:Uncharacterized protein n=1 Tax=Pistacia integerrima TaxID=434235 RepID=A0ACC0X2M9_9ROSI|nr:hypothetical protein Pint_33997 [Pistacia integerrima]